MQKFWKKRLMAVGLAATLTFTQAAVVKKTEVQAAENTEIYVQPIEGYNSNSIRGVDVSSYLSLMDSFEEINKTITDTAKKVGFRDVKGNYLDKQGFFDLLAESGINYVRLRVWNNPYDSNGNGYGGGNNDLEKAKEMGRYATKAGMKVLIDFHFSDFWADPGKQKAPKEWSNYSVEEKQKAIADYVTDSLTELKNAQVDVGMVQIGNETTGGFCGETDWYNMNKLFDAGCDALHEFNQSQRTDIKAVLHFTNPEKEGAYATYAANLADYDGDGDGNKEGVSYDVFASSYYPYWHGTMSNLTSVLTDVAQKYNKYVMVAETSWATTYDDGDGHSNTIGEGSDLGDYVNYDISVQGQADEIRDVAEAVNKVSVKLQNGDAAGLGMFYWEPAWIPVQCAYSDEGTFDDAVYANNKEIWEKYGSGWASSYSGEYDADDAGKWYGGSAVDNQAFFDFNGYPLDSLNVFNCFAGTGSNLITDSGFENQSSAWQIQGSGVEIKEEESNAKNGTKCTHFWSEDKVSFTLTQKVAIAEDGLYTAAMNIQGAYGSESGNNSIYLTATVGDNTYTSNQVSMKGWRNWQKAVIKDILVSAGEEVTLTLNVDVTAGSWGAVDDASFYRTGELKEEHIHNVQDNWNSDEGKHWHTCDGCDERLDEAEHNLVEKKDSEKHWKECSVCEEKLEEEQHDFGDWEVVEKAGCETEGKETRTCKTCHYEESRVIEANGHEIKKEVWNSDEESHWHECSICGDKEDYAEHIMKWVIDTEPTEYNEGSRYEECEVCGARGKVESIPKLETTEEKTTEEKTTEERTTEEKATEIETTEGRTTEEKTTEGRTTEERTTEEKTTEVETTEGRTTEERTTEEKTTEVETTEGRTTEERTTEERTTEERTTEEKTTEGRTTEERTTEEKTTEGRTTEERTTEEKTTEVEATEERTTEERITEEKTTEVETTEKKTTEGRTTEERTTEKKTTEGRTTEERTTEEKITEVETTEKKTTEGRTTEERITEEKTTEVETTEKKTTEEKTTEVETTEKKTTEGRTTEERTTEEKTIEVETTEKKTTEGRTTEERTTEEKTTEVETTEKKTTEGRTTEERTTEKKTTEVETTEKKTTEGRTTEERTTEEKTTEVETTEKKTTEGRTTEERITEEKTTEEKTTEKKTTEERTTERETTEGRTSEEKTTEVVTTEGRTTEEKTTEEKTSEERTTEVVTTEIKATEQEKCKHQTTEVRNQKKATIEQTGYTGDVYCVDCNEKLQSGKIIAKKAIKKGDKIKVKIEKQTVTVKVTKVATSGTGTVTYVKVNNRNVKNIQIPDTVTIQGKKYKVTQIADKAFSYYTALNTVTIGKNVKKIGRKTFYQAIKLKKIVIKGKNLKVVGKNAISGISRKAVIAVPKGKKKAYKALWNKKAGFKKTMEIK